MTLPVATIGVRVLHTRAHARMCHRVPAQLKGRHDSYAAVSLEGARRSEGSRLAQSIHDRLSAVRTITRALAGL